ncbi:MAG: HlyD family efflux transporter periplasmic adaptor subunit [Saprospiraceae bacterium]|nr:HlyD family efflux transporter periplasmic adaptor subunit [Saprospiraceae bacterium]
MREPKDFIELRSEEVQEILGAPPGWLVRWGTTVVLLGFAALVVVAWLVRYPDVVEADVEITTSTPPAEVVARSDGRLESLFVVDTQYVVVNQPLAVLQSTANYKEVLALDSCVSIWRTMPIEYFKNLQIPDSLDLGELQTDYANFSRMLSDFKFGRETGSASYQSSVSSIQSQISQLEQSIIFEQKALVRIKDQLKSAEELYEKQKELYEQGITSRVDFEKERTKLAELERQRDQYEDNIIQKRREIISLKNAMNKESYGRQESSSSASTLLVNSLNLLNTGLDRWKQSYLLLAPVEGKAALNGLTNQQFIRLGETLMMIVPVNSNIIVGRAKLPIAGSGKVKEDQKVILKLDNYPYREFGTITGKVFSKSLVPKDKTYSIMIALPNTSSKKLRTSMGKEIDFSQQLQGKAEIVTEDKGFLQRIVEQMYGVLKQ